MDHPRVLPPAWRAFCVLLALLALLAWRPLAQAADAPPTAADPQLEARVQELAAELRCLVCQNQSLADSHAELAIDLKNQVREQLRAGRTNQQVIDYMTQRFGDFVLYRPPWRAATLLLWLGPFLLLVGGLLLLWRVLGAHSRSARAEPLDEATLRRLDSILAEPDARSVPTSGRVNG